MPCCRLVVRVEGMRHGCYSYEALWAVLCRHKVHANQIYKWKRQLLENARVLSRPKRWAEAMPRCARPNCFSRGAWSAIFYHTGSVDCDDAPAGVGRTPLSMRWQCELGVNRSSLYYEPASRMATHCVGWTYMKGSRDDTEKAEGSAVNRKRVQRLMRLMGLESTAPKPNTSKPAPEHAVTLIY